LLVFTTPWNLISGILGVTCLLLMATMGILLQNLYSKQSIQPTLSPDAVTELQKGRFHILENLSVGRG
uniref:Uncharacterized protein n=1 Tax=Ursus americanus TaxID=9643 RepID=A0A452Q987_URSAM